MARTPGMVESSGVSVYTVPGVKVVLIEWMVLAVASTRRSCPVVAVLQTVSSSWVGAVGVGQMQRRRGGVRPYGDRTGVVVEDGIEYGCRIGDRKRPDRRHERPWICWIRAGHVKVAIDELKVIGAATVGQTRHRVLRDRGARIGHRRIDLE